MHELSLPMRRSSAIASVASLFGSAAWPASARAADPLPLTLAITGHTASAWPTYVADTMGFYTRNGLAMDIVIAGSPQAGTQQLAGGSADVADVSWVQIVQASIGGAPIKAIFDRSPTAPFVIFGKKGITSLQQLAGKTIIIGGPNDITRIFTDTILRRAKLNLDDISYLYAGGTAERYAALLSGAVDAAILNAPFMFRAQEGGYPLLADVSATFPQFPFGSYVVNTTWAKTHRATIVALIVATIQATQWLYDPKNRDHAVAILAQTTNSPPEDAGKTYEYYIDRLKFYNLNGVATPEKIQMAIDAVVQFKLATPPLPPPASYYDNSYVAAANAQLKVR